MPILVDGNNLMHRLPRNQRTRAGVRDLVLRQTRQERITVTVVFDGPPPDSGPEKEHLGAVTIRYSGGRSADAVILSTLPERGAKDWTVVTDDRSLADRARDRGAGIRRLDEWLGRPGRPKRAPKRPYQRPIGRRELEDWEEAFAHRPEEPDRAPKVVLSKRRRRR
jgi:hypothetical protein